MITKLSKKQKQLLDDILTNIQSLNDSITIYTTSRKYDVGIFEAIFSGIDKKTLVARELAAEIEKRATTEECAPNQEQPIEIVICKRLGRIMSEICREFQVDKAARKKELRIAELIVA